MRFVIKIDHGADDMFRGRITYVLTTLAHFSIIVKLITFTCQLTVL